MQDNLTKLKELVDLFHINIIQYKSQNYDEANLRVDFADKFFEILEWDVRNTQGFAENYRDVVREDKIIITGKPKAPDYSFRIGGHRKFFVETKRPSVNIKEDSDSAFQIRRYGYTAKLPLCILTDFEEFAIYDTRIKPSQKDNSSVGRIFYCTYEEYEKNFEFIYNTFAKTSILKGSFDRYVNEKKNKKGTSEFDKEFLKLIEGWRTDLAKNIAKNNQKIGIEEINFAVQKIINRIIFLRIAEDRHIEEYEILLNLTKRKNVYKHFSEFCVKADEKYNSQLFYTEDFLKKLSIDDDILVEIIEGLYFPKSPYEFSVMEVEILGNIYEQFLGKIIRLTPGHNAKVEEKPEVRKAGGVYYTPQYIVDYIVENTVGETLRQGSVTALRQSKGPKDVESLTILDPACGSGSFLLGAYSYLMEYHLDYYIKNLDRSLKDGNIYQISENNYKLTIEEKRKILLNNIYGVDIDSQAVEVTKLSLLLKLMENENQESVGSLFKYSDTKVLPDLSNNIKCGNSLIGTDFYSNQDLGLFENKDIKKVNAFDWDKEFPEIFKKGGFDVVIGNPPYIEYRLISNAEITYLKTKYLSTRTKEKWSIYIPFLELGSKLLNSLGVFGNIIPNTFLSADFGKPLRKFTLEYLSIISIVDVSHLKVFGKVGTYPILFFYTKNKINNNKIKMSIPEVKESLNKKDFDLIDQSEILEKNQNYVISTSYSKDNFDVIQKIEKQGIHLKNLVGKFSWGTSISGFKSYKISSDRFKQLSDRMKSKYNKVIQTADIKSYRIEWQSEYIEKSIYSPQVIQHFEKQKIVIARLTKRIQATLDSEKYYMGKSSFITDPKINPNYLLALLNSKLLNYFFSIKFSNTHLSGGYLRFDIPYLEKLPIKTISSADKAEFQIQKNIISNVDQMFNIQKKYQIAKYEHEKNQYKKRIDIIDQQIDQLVYELYGLTEEEIKIVEGEEKK